ncbi:MAG: PAS domain S-box protein [Proteobacteria bacterium]|nr:PAS domain S-box protein [Pseudomonadota bacterium]
MVETILYNESRSRKQWDRKHAGMLAILDAQSLDTPREGVLLNRIRTNHMTADTLYTRLTGVADAGIGTAESRMVKEVQARTVSALLLVTQEMLDDANELSRINQSSIIAAQKSGEKLILITVLLVGAIMGWIWWLIRSRVLSPIAVLQKGTAMVATGSLDHRLGLRGRDEIGSLANAFDTMTEQLQLSRDKLTESETRYRLTIEAINVGTWDIDVPSGKVACDAHCYQMLGFEPNAFPLSVEEWLSRMNPEDQEEARVNTEALLASGATRTFEFRFRDSTGHWRWLQGRGRVVEWLDGRPKRVLGTNTDISARKAAELAMTLERTRIETILRTASDGIHVIDGGGLLIEANEAFLKMLGYDQTAIGRLHVGDWDAQDEWDVIRMRNDALIDTKATKVFETRHKRSDGRILDVEISACGIDIAGQGLIYAASRDITERKRGENQLRLAASVFKNSGEGIVITDADNLIVDVNEAFSAITGYSRSDVLSKNPSLLKSGQHDKEFYAALWQALANDGHWQGEVWNRRRNGEIYVERLTISAVHDSAGKLTHYVAVMSDITETKQYQERLEKAAHYDELTGLPNRVLFADRIHLAIAQTQRSRTLLVVGYLDLDGFKPINDNYGHEAGDHVLVDIAERLRSCLRGGDTVARFGGDEFVFLLLGLDRLEECELALQRILDAMVRPLAVVGSSVCISASIGITLFPTDDVDADALLRHADQAMYLAKQAGKNRYHIFKPDEQVAPPTIVGD